MDYHGTIWLDFQSIIPVLDSIKIMNPNCYFHCCPCHIFHNTAWREHLYLNKQACSASMILLLIYIISLISWRKENISFQIIDSSVMLNTKKYVEARWLSLNTAISWILHGYDALKSYFLLISPERSQHSYIRLKKTFENPMTKVYYF